MKSKIIDVVCLSLAAALFGSVAVLNIVQKDRPTQSLTEKRELAKMPEFSLDSLCDGSYFSGVAAFVSDTFIGRDKIVALSEKMETLKGVDYSINGSNNFALLSPVDNPTDNSSEHEELSNKLTEALDSLNKTNPTGSGDSNPDENDGFTNTVKDETATPETTPPEPPESNPPETEPATPTEPETEPETKSEPETETESETAKPEESETTPETEPEPTETTPETEAQNEVTGIHLSKTYLKLTVGSGSAVSATVDTSNNEGVMVKWSISDKSVASITVNESGGINVKGEALGTATLTCFYGDVKQDCKVEVVEISTAAAQPSDGHADFLASGLFIYGDAVYTQAWYSDSAAEVYSQTVEYYKKLFGDAVNVSVVVAPVSSMVVDNEEVQSKIQNQDEMIQKIGAHMSADINFVNPYAEMYEHKDEYLFFKSDHHWTQRGAYYAYRAFAKSVGYEPTALEDFTYEIRNDNYSGSLYSWTADERVKYFKDTIEAFRPTKSHTMTVTGSNGAVNTYDTSIVNTNQTYVTFIAGDNPYTVINVPDNPQDKNILVLKDSFGNAFVPFLCEHYGNIIVVDVRYANFNIYDQLKDYGLSDIVFVNNAQAVTSQWAQMYLKAVGVN